MTLAYALVALVAVAPAATKRKPQPVPAAVKLLDKGQTEFRRGDFSGALRWLDLAAEESKDDGLTAKIHLLRGQALSAQQKDPQAEDAFIQALEFDPSSTLDPEKVDPTVVRVLEQAKAKARGELRVRADSESARLLVDGKPAGALPYQGRHGIGVHRLEVRSADGRSAAREVTVRANRTVEVDLALAVPPVVVVPDPPQKKEVPPEPTAYDTLQRAGGRLAIDARLPLEPGTASWYGLEVGLGAELAKWRFIAGVRYSPTLWGITPRAQLRVPVSKTFGVYGAAEAPVYFTPWAAVGLGTGVGLEFKLTDWVSAYGEGGVRYFFNARTPFEPFRVGVSGGLLFAIGK